MPDLVFRQLLVHLVLQGLLVPLADLCELGVRNGLEYHDANVSLSLVYEQRSHLAGFPADDGVLAGLGEDELAEPPAAVHVVPGQGLEPGASF